MAITTQQTYITACNIMWFDLFQSAIPAVPLSRRRLEELGDWYFRDGHTFLSTMIMAAIPSPENMVAVPHLRCISPEEQLHAVIYAAAKHLPECDDRLKGQWKRTLSRGSVLDLLTALIGRQLKAFVCCRGWGSLPESSWCRSQRFGFDASGSARRSTRSTSP